MTFPFSNHNYQLRFWMAAGGLDPDEDVRLVVLPPPYMVESIASRHVDGFCVGAPWNSVAVELGIGRILHFGCDIIARSSEKVLAVRGTWSQQHPDRLQRLLRALRRAADFIEQPKNRGEVAALLAEPNRIAVPREIVRGTLEGNLKIAADGTRRANARYFEIGDARGARPAPLQAAWIYAQMVRWGQAPLSPELLMAARSVYRPDLYDAAIGDCTGRAGETTGDGISAFAGPPFNPADISQHLAAWARLPLGRPRLVTD
jgi:NitT/TauT family transport system ATP-binding protein